MEESFQNFIADLIARRISGDIVYSNNPNIGLKKWRDYFEVSQLEVARIMGVSASVISDYEKGRRVPGAKFIQRYVRALLTIDHQRGWKKLDALSKALGIPRRAIIDMMEFNEPITIGDLISLVDGILLSPNYADSIRVYGYTLIDSIRAIAELSGPQFYFLLGSTPERAIIFTNVTAGRSPMVAIRVSLVKPGIIIIHGPRRYVDPLAIELARLEGLPLILSLAKDINTLIRKLRSKAGSDETNFLSVLE
ncbi:putative transcriptional regulator [Caldisphaera lagunensis DSM 15908]|uniref:Putative transcriptional regulator n=1 Tax=Caldisphaera lagunensis (strain DSM 15908 / JCM 11604 / ANMR 0165 / IC-154) TaxID=1056495 RepID=L0A9K1_CALLD|nr:helix-turn-helix domain-containing protein [Caldisphaera lagunensis]AFZ69812.1 putative transcriptional regulator [Caldisphaera lagunensis DSM 15908]